MIKCEVRRSSFGTTEDPGDGCWALWPHRFAVLRKAHDRWRDPTAKQIAADLGIDTLLFNLSDDTQTRTLPGRYRSSGTHLPIRRLAPVPRN